MTSGRYAGGGPRSNEAHGSGFRRLSPIQRAAKLRDGEPVALGVPCTPVAAQRQSAGLARFKFQAAFAHSRSTNFCTLPVDVIGRSRKTMCRGHL